ALGMSVKLSGLNLAPSNTAVGVYVAPTSNSKTYSALFMGGSVGVGTQTPASTLTVSGDLLGTRLILANSSFELDSITANIILGTGSGVVSVNGTLSLASVGLLPSLIATQSLNVGSFSAVTVNLTSNINTTLNSTYISGWVGKFASSNVNGTVMPAKILSFGTARVTGNVTLTSGNINVSKLSGIANSLVLNVSTASFKATTVNFYSATPKAILLKPTSNKVLKDIGLLFVDSTNNDNELIYRYSYSNGSTITANLSKAIMSGSPYNVPQYDSSGSLSSTQTGVAVTTNSVGSFFAVSANYSSNTSVTTNTLRSLVQVSAESLKSLNAASINMTFDRRITPSTNVFIGSNISMRGLGLYRKSTSPVERDLAYGLYVDVSRVLVDSSTELPTDLDHSITGNRYAAVFLADKNHDTNGTVGIFLKNYGASYSTTPSPNALLHLSDKFDYIKNADNLSDQRGTFNTLLVEVGGSNPIAKVLTVRSNTQFEQNIGIPIYNYVAIGEVSVTTSRLAVKGLANSGGLLSVKNTLGTSLLEIATATVGVGTANPMAKLHIVGDGTTRTTIVSGNASTFGINANGMVGFGTELTYALDAIRPDSLSTTPIVRIATSNQSSSEVLIVNEMGRAGIGTSNVSAGFMVRSIYLVGTANNIPSTYNYTKYNSAVSTRSAGLLVASNNRYLFTGISVAPGSTPVTSNLISTASLSLYSDLGIGMVLTSRSVAISTANAKGLVTIGASNSDVMVKLTGRNDSRFLVDGTGVGIGGVSPLMPMTVSGSVRIFGNPTGNLVSSLLTSTLVNVTSDQKTAVRIAATLREKTPKTLQSIAMNIGYEATRNLSGYSLRLATASSLAGLNSTNYSFNGLNIDLTGLNASDPTFVGGSKNGYKYSALFKGGQVAIGTMNAIGDSTQLVVAAMSPTGSKLATGDMIRFVTSYNSTTRTQLTLSVQDPIQLKHTYIDPNAFFVIKDITSDEVRSLCSALTNLAIGFVPTAPYLATTNVLAATIDPFVGVVNGIKYSQATAILRASRSQLPFQITVSSNYYGTTGPNYGLTIVNGYKGVTSNYEFSPWAGTLLIGHTMSVVPTMDTVTALSVSGDVRVGIVTGSEFASDQDGVGSKLYFSGGYSLISNMDSDNKDPMYAARYNKLSNNVVGSEFRLAVGETYLNAAAAKWNLGSIDNVAPFSKVNTVFTMAISPYTGSTPQGGIGIGTTIPQAALHVSGNQISLSSSHARSNNLMIVEASKNATYALAIKNQGTASDANFISFIFKNTVMANDPANYPTYSPTVVGAIEPDGSGGVQFASPEADYSEYIVKKDSRETLEPGDVVFVDHGAVSRKGGDQSSRLMVISTAPVILGNWDPESVSKSVPVAFTGQVPIKVIGRVLAGDYLVPSGRNDGTAVAWNPSSNVSSRRIFAQAWESSDRKSVSKIKGLIGFPFAQHEMARKYRNIQQATTSEIGLYTRDTLALERDLLSKVMARQERINRLRDILNSKTPHN
ncbi:hypothetical protein EB093_01225, partial [bacterium]|nr:hypothetical protein [bacterium]